MNDGQDWLPDPEPQPKSAILPAVQALSGGLPQVLVGGRQLREESDDALAALQRFNNPPRLFVRGGLMVEIVRDEKRREVIREVSEAALRGNLTRAANFYKRGAKGLSGVAPPLEIVRDVHALPPARWGFQPLDAVVSYPILRADGTILTQSGYDPATQLFYAPDPDLELPPIPESPEADDIDAAKDLLDEALGEFPYADDASRTHAIAALLTVVIRSAIDGPTPLFLFDAPQAGTGKSLLADFIAIVATGRAGEMFGAPKDDEETRKLLTTALMSANPLVVIDNIVRRLDNGDLAKVLTETWHADRVFRTHQKVVLPVRCAWIATGNNIRLGGDLPRRCVWVRLDARTSRPFLREGFKIDDLKNWSAEHRGELLAAILTMARAWFVGGRKRFKGVPLGSYENWSLVIGGILEYARFENFLGNAFELYKEADGEATQWEGFLKTLFDVFDGSPFTVAQVAERLRSKAWNELGTVLQPSDQAAALKAALPDYLVEASDRDGFFRRRLGKCFAEHCDRRFGESQVYLHRAGIKHNVQEWVVELPSMTGG